MMTVLIWMGRSTLLSRDISTNYLESRLHSFACVFGMAAVAQRIWSGGSLIAVFFGVEVGFVSKTY